jgi:TrmH family RNA methyltransferase
VVTAPAAGSVIRSRANPVVRRFQALKDRGLDGELLLIEGIKLLEEAQASRIVIVEVAATPEAEAREPVAALLARLRAAGTPVRLLEARVLGALSELPTSQGVLALARRPSFDEDALFRGVPLLVVGVAVQNPGNLGGLLRTAEAAGSTGAFFTEGCADPFSWKALRGSMGSAFRLPHVAGRSFAVVESRLRERGVRVVATASAGGEPYDRAQLDGPLALLCGNEAAGLPESVIARADLKVHIPLLGTVESLNVGVAAGIVLFEAARQRRVSGAGKPKEVERA